MKTIDLFDCIEDQSVQLRPHGVVNMKRIEELTMQKLTAQNTKNNKHHRPLGVYMLAAVLITLLMATTVFAYVGFTKYENPLQMLKAFYSNEEIESIAGGEVYTDDEYKPYTVVLPTIERVPLDEKLAEEVTPPIAAVGQSVTWDDYTLTIVAHQHDKNLGAGTIYYTVENPNGLEGYYTQFNGELTWSGGEIMALQGAAFENFLIPGETTDTTLSVACYYHGTERREEWRSKDYFEMSFYHTDQTIQLPKYAGDENTAALMSENGEILITAIGMDIRIQDMEFLYFPTFEDIGSSAYARPEISKINYLALQFSDGTEYIVEKDRDGEFIENFAYSSGYTDDVFGVISTYNFNRIIDPSKVTGVRINDNVFPVEICKDVSVRMNMFPKAEVIPWEDYLSRFTITEIEY